MIQQVRELILISQDTPEEKPEEEYKPNTQMQDIFNKFADIYGKEKQNETAQEKN